MDNKKLAQEIQKMLEQELKQKQKLYEFADLTPDDTNLPCVVWVDGPRNMKHGFRIKFQNSYSSRLNGEAMIPMTISNNPEIPKSIKAKLKINQKELSKIKDWVVLNKEILIAYAKGEITTKQLYLSIKPI